MTQILAGAALVTPTEIVPDGWVEVDGSSIVALGAGAPPRPADVVLDGGYLGPGFIDIHSHGGGGASVVGADPAAVACFAEAHRQHGTTTIVASLVSAHSESLAEGGVSAHWPASILQMHPHATVVIDEDAASQLRLTSYYTNTYEGKPDWQGI